ncbi:regulator of telomere elongation helicase 1 homolog isoform X2 [Panonychus citri]|uniref:regulator of telomere elongation helicase 1 homolog isoform X2 n=1 Tax=Panonychus citri TaxID=50023 RepID=UPI0023081CD5|nr:regulator of telomere elongation helicase 1 homolog isoform X2 [Panonychus citri]
MFNCTCIGWFVCLFISKKNGLLESPTGTGKTLSLLCSTLSWLEKKNRTPLLEYFTSPSLDGTSECQGASSDDVDFVDLCAEPDDLVGISKDEKKKDEKKGPVNEQPTTKVLYSSRTHAQLSQACKEMKRSHYNFMPGLVMGGRDNLCINEEVSKLENNTAKTHACRAKTKAKQCPYHLQYEKKVLTIDDFNSTPILDIEDLNTLGKKHKVCPYYALRILKQKSDVIFMPYNYLLDPSARKALGIEIANNVIIFDEGHNIERICEDSVSGELKSESIEYLIKELKTLTHHLKSSNLMNTVAPEALDAMQGLSLNSVTFLKDMLIAFQGEVEKAVQDVQDKKVHQQKWIFETLETVGVPFEKHTSVFEAIDQIMNYIIEASLFAGNNNFASFSAHLEKLNDFFLIVFPDGYDDEKSWLEFKGEFLKKYRVFTEKENEENSVSMSNGHTKVNGYSQATKKFKGWTSTKRESTDQRKPWTLYLWCLSASIGLNSLQKKGAHCTIITSGTLAPLQSFQIELETPFPVILQNRHIINESQIGIYTLSLAYNNIRYNTSYENRSNLEHIKTIGQSIVNFCNIIPDGVLIFFSSYAVMGSILKVWREHEDDKKGSLGWKIFANLRAKKTLFEEPKDKNEFANCIVEYKKKIDQKNSKGAVFMGICRGKLSEGLDMADHYCRGVLMVGLPFPATQDPRVLVKKQYLQEQNNPELSPTDWYTLQMKRALNQAIGRIVRHKDDYGVVLLIDHRFEKFVAGLSKWMHPYVKNVSYSEATRAVTAFFQRHQAKSKNDIIL